jgi:hypothetical protein
LTERQTDRQNTKALERDREVESEGERAPAKLSSDLSFEQVSRNLRVFSRQQRPDAKHKHINSMPRMVSSKSKQYFHIFRRILRCKISFCARVCVEV